MSKHVSVLCFQHFSIKYKSGICAVTLGFPAAEHFLIYTPNWNTVVIEKCQKEKRKFKKKNRNYRLASKLLYGSPICNVRVQPLHLNLFLRLY